MAAKALRLVALAALAGAGAWVGRLLAHSKTPPPEGRWSELSDDILDQG